MARILGLDLGSYSVKAVLLESQLRSNAVKGALEAKLDPTLGDQALSQALDIIAAQAASWADSIVVSLPGARIATHSVNLPFNDPKKLEATVGFEVENELPFDLSEAAFDYQVIQSDPHGSHLLVGLVRREDFERLLAQLKGHRLDPRVVTHPSLALQPLLQGLPADAHPESVTVLDLGHERSCLAIGRAGVNVDFARVLAGGGALLTRSLAKTFGISIEDAASWKEAHGALGNWVVGPDAERAETALLAGLSQALRELKSTLKAYNTKGHLESKRLLLTGGGAALKGLDSHLGASLGMEAIRWSPPQELTAAAGAHAERFASAYALALRGAQSSAKAPRFNLRRGEYALQSALDHLKARGPRLAVYAGILLALLFLGTGATAWNLSRREDRVDAAICDLTKAVLGSCEKNADRALNMMQGKESPAASLPQKTALHLTKELLERVPPSAGVTFDQMDVQLDRIALRCTATSNKQEEALVASLKKHPCFREIKEGRIDKSKDGLKVGFRLDIQVDCNQPEVAQR